MSTAERSREGANQMTRRQRTVLTF